jgi:predicted kinase
MREDVGMADQPKSRSVKISEDERGGWSSDRPRRDGAPPRPADVSVRCQVLSPSHEIRYSPGSLLLIVSPSLTERDRFTQQLIENRASLLSLGRVRVLLTGRVPEEEIAGRAEEILDAAIVNRLEENETVVLTAEGLGAEERERYVRLAARFRRPRHLILIDSSGGDIQEHDRAALNELRRRLDAGELGAEGFHTALRLGGGNLGELKRILFKQAPRDD